MIKIFKVKSFAHTPFSNENDLEETIIEIELIDQKINTLQEKEQRKKRKKRGRKKALKYVLFF